MKISMPGAGRASTIRVGTGARPSPWMKERVVHLHIPKTAGNSLKTAMENCTTKKIRIFPHWHEEEYLSVVPEDYDFYSGHIGYETARKLGGEIISVFRNPVDRFISVYYYWRFLHDTDAEVRQATIIASKYSLDQFVRIRDVFALHEELDNRMTFQTALGFSPAQRERLRVEGNTDEDIFKMAVRNVDTFAVVGIQEELSKFAANIQNRYGVELAMEYVNQTEGKIATQDISFATKSRILDWVYMDLELYQHVLQLCRERASEAREQPANASGRAWDGR